MPGQYGTDETLDAADGDDRVSRIEMAGDLDVYRVELEAGVTLQIEVNGQASIPLADPFLAVLNEARRTRVTSDDDGGRGPRRAASASGPTEAGTYYFIQASGLGGTIGGMKFRSRVSKRKR